MDTHIALLILGISFLQNLLGVKCLSTTTFPATDNQEPGATLPQTPIWIKCLRVDESELALDSLRSLVLISAHWCSHAEFILNCLEKEIPQFQEQYPLDFFVNLNYDPKTMREKSKQLCASKPGISFLQNLLGVKCLSTTTFPATDNQEPGATLPQTPIWIKCLRVDESELALDSLRSLVLISAHWCSHVEFILNCLEKEIPQFQEQYPLDFFVNLNYDPKTMREKSKQLCASKPESRKKLECTDNVTNDDIMECSMRFKQSVDYLYFVRNMTDITEEILKEMTCDITRETSRCIAARLQSCDVDVSMFLNGYYGLFTNNDCLYNTSIPVEPMRPLPAQPEPTVVITCGIEAMSFMEGDVDRPMVPTGNISQAIIVSVLQQDCKMYRQRFLCYEREFPSATAFLDIWQKSVFSLRNSIISNEQFCETIGEFTSSLDAKCYNKVDRQLQNCESFYGRRIINSRVEWNNDKSNVNIQKLACNASIERATCLKEAFSICGEYVSTAYSNLQYRMLPDECFLNGLPAGVPPLPEEDAYSRPNREKTTSQPQSEPKPVSEETEAAVGSANSPKGGNSGITTSISVILILCSVTLNVHQLT